MRHLGVLLLIASACSSPSTTPAAGEAIEAPAVETEAVEPEAPLVAVEPEAPLVVVEPELEPVDPTAPPERPFDEPPPEGEIDLEICTVDRPLTSLAEPVVSALALRGDGALVAATPAGIVLLRDGTGRACDLAQRAESPSGRSGAVLAADRARPGRVWLAAAGRLAALEGDALTEVETAPLDATAMVGGHSGGVWVVVGDRWVVTGIPGSVGIASDARFTTRLGTHPLPLLVFDTGVLVRVGDRLRTVGLEGTALSASRAVAGAPADLARLGTNGNIALASREPHAIVRVIGIDGTERRTIAVGETVDFALQFAAPADGPATLTALSEVVDGVAYAAFDVIRGGPHEAVLVSIRGL